MMDERMRNLKLVAHRGYPQAFPENTLLGYQQAVVHGATFVEADVQCTWDGVPVLYHDASTRRLSGVEGTIADRTFDEIGALNAHHPERFGDRFTGTPVPSLRTFAGWLAGRPGVTAFVEIKEESLQRAGVVPVMEKVMQALESVIDRCVIISFDDRCVEHAARGYDIRTGWVLRNRHGQAEARARQLAPDYLFTSKKRVPERPEDIWEGPWQWAVYVVDDFSAALSFVERGIHYVETDDISGMLDQYRAGQPDGT